MNLKIKLFLVGMALLAIVSAQQLYSSVRATRDAAAILPATYHKDPLPGTDPDFDNDGLSNSEESYWNTDIDKPDTDGDGFKDGEEVASGHDPLKPGPNDFQDPKKNLSDRVSDLLTAGLMAGDLLPTSEKFQDSIDRVTLSVINDFYDSQPGIPAVPIIEADSSVQNEKAYLEYIASVIKEQFINFRFFPTFDANLIFTPESSTHISDQMAAIHTALAATPVPKSWRDAHLKLLDMFERFRVNYRYLAVYEQDPLRALMAAKEIEYIYTVEGPQFLKDFGERLEERQVPLSDDFFYTLRLLYRK